MKKSAILGMLLVLTFCGQTNAAENTAKDSSYKPQVACAQGGERLPP